MKNNGGALTKIIIFVAILVIVAVAVNVLLTGLQK